MITKNLRVNWIRSKSRCENLLRNTLIQKRNSRISRGRMLQWRVKMKRSKVQSQLFRPTSERLTQFRHTITLSRPFNSLIKSRLVQISRRILRCLIHPLLKRCTRIKRTLEDLWLVVLNLQANRWRLHLCRPFNLMELVPRLTFSDSCWRDPVRVSLTTIALTTKFTCFLVQTLLRMSLRPCFLWIKQVSTSINRGAALTTTCGLLCKRAPSECCSSTWDLLTAPLMPFLSKPLFRAPILPSVEFWPLGTSSLPSDIGKKTTLISGDSQIRMLLMSTGTKPFFRPSHLKFSCRASSRT